MKQIVFYLHIKCLITLVLFPRVYVENTSGAVKLYGHHKTAVWTHHALVKMSLLKVTVWTPLLFITYSTLKMEHFFIIDNNSVEINSEDIVYKSAFFKFV